MASTSVASPPTSPVADAGYFRQSTFGYQIYATGQESSTQEFKKRLVDTLKTASTAFDNIDGQHAKTNEDLGELKDGVQKLQTDVTEVKDRVARLEDTVTQLGKTVDNNFKVLEKKIDDKFDDLSSKITELQELINKRFTPTPESSLRFRKPSTSVDSHAEPTLPTIEVPDESDAGLEEVDADLGRTLTILQRARLTVRRVAPALRKSMPDLRRQRSPKS